MGYESTMKTMEKLEVEELEELIYLTELMLEDYPFMPS